MRVVRPPTRRRPVCARNRGAGASPEASWWRSATTTTPGFPESGRVLVDFLGAAPRRRWRRRRGTWCSTPAVTARRCSGARSTTDRRSCCGRTSWRCPSPWCGVRRSRFDVGFDPDLPPARTGTCGCVVRRSVPCAPSPTSGTSTPSTAGARVTRTAESQVTGGATFWPNTGSHDPLVPAVPRGGPRRVRAGPARDAAAARAGPGAAPRDAAVVAALLASASPPVRVGRRRRDPGLQARLMAAVVDAPDPPARAVGPYDFEAARSSGGVAPRIVGEGRRCVAPGAAPATGPTAAP